MDHERRRRKTSKVHTIIEALPLKAECSLVPFTIHTSLGNHGIWCTLPAERSSTVERSLGGSRIEKVSGMM